MKKIVSLLLTAIMLFCLLPMVMPEDAIAATELVASGGSYYYDGHEHTVAAEVKDGPGYTIQYSYYSVYEKATWTTDVPKLVEPGSLVVYVRAVKGTDILTHDPILLEVVGNAPAGSTVKIIANGSITKAPVYKSPDTNSEKVGEFIAGDNCTLVSQQDKWFELTDGTTTGFVHFEYVKITSRPNGGGGGGTPDLTKVEITAYGGTYLYDGNVHRVQASLIHGDGFTLEFSVDNGKTWTTTAPGLTQPGKLTVKIHATSSVGIKEHPDVVLQVLASLPSGTDVKIKAHGSTTKAPLRQGPSESSRRLDKIDAGTVVTFLASEGEWIKINHGGLEGYVFHWFVDLEDLEIKPMITSQPENTWVMENQNAIFTIIAQGQGDISYQWQWYNGSAWQNVASGGTSPSYIFKATSADNGKKLRCVVTDSNGKVTSDVATLTVVTTAPIIEQQPENGGSVDGKNVRFTVYAIGAESYQWYCQKPNTTDWNPVEAESAHTASLTVKLSTQSNGSKYKCKLTNSIGSVETNEVTLMIVKKPPKIVVQPVKKTANEGGSVTFTITATGDAVTYQWWRKLKGKSWEVCTGPTAKTASYTESSLTYDRNGAQYRCVVQNARKKVTSKSVKLTLKGLAATITVQPSNWSGADKTMAVFKVTATGTGTLKYQWYYLKPGSTKWKKCSGAKEDTYSFVATKKKNGYKYRCVVTNNGTPVTSSEALLTVY